MKRQHFYLSIMAEIYVKTTLLPAYHGGNLCKDNIITCLSLRKFMLRRHYYYLPIMEEIKIQTTLLPSYHGGNLCKDDIITCLSWRKFM